MTIDRADFPRASPRPGLLLTDLTSNIILLTTLFAVNRQPLSGRNVSGLLLASLVLVVVHVAAVVTNAQSIYALRPGPWSERNYGSVARNFWDRAAGVLPPPARVSSRTKKMATGKKVAEEMQNVGADIAPKGTIEARRSDRPRVAPIEPSADDRAVA